MLSALTSDEMMFFSLTKVPNLQRVRCKCHRTGFPRRRQCEFCCCLDLDRVGDKFESADTLRAVEITDSRKDRCGAEKSTQAYAGNAEGSVLLPDMSIPRALAAHALHSERLKGAVLISGASLFPSLVPRRSEPSALRNGEAERTHRTRF